MLPRLFGAGIVQLNFWMNTLLCTFQGSAILGTGWIDGILAIWLNNLAIPFNQGSLNGLTYAFALMLMPQAVIAQSIAIASMPTFSAQVSLDQFDDFRHSLATSLRAVLMLSIPASIGLILLRVPIISLLYQRGSFSAESTLLVAWPLLWYSAGLVGHSLVEVLSRAFYALHNTKTPVIIGALAMTLNILLSLVFSVIFSRMGWMPHGGLALANSLATALEMIGLLVLLRRRLVRMEGKRIWQIIWQACLAGGLMAAAILIWLALSSRIRSLDPGGSGNRTRSRNLCVSFVVLARSRTVQLAPRSQTPLLTRNIGLINATYRRNLLFGFGVRSAWFPTVDSGTRGGRIVPRMA